MAHLTSVADPMDQHDPAQVAMMEERLILLDLDDNPIGVETKKNCKPSPLHTKSSNLLTPLSC